MTPAPTPSEVSLPPAPDPVWALADPPDPDAVRRLEAALKLPAPLCAVLSVRGFDDPQRAKAFLRPHLDHLHDPGLLPDASVAVERVARAIRGGETILVHGDYDVDGICSTALLTRWIRRLGGRVEPFVPHRIRDGYDFGPAGLAAARKAGATLVITADCGTSALEAVADAGREGIDVVVTDHHAPPGELPRAVALVNPKRRDSEYPESELAGAGVAFKLCRLLARELGGSPEELLSHLDLVAVATVADLVPLRGENRVLARFGLRALERTENPGLRALLEVSGLDGRALEAGSVGFGLGPRINAVGRMGDAARGLRLLLTDDEDEARNLARELDGLNRERREEDRETLREALEILTREFDPAGDHGVVLAREGWHPGVIGIVASRVVERIHRPTVLVALDGDRGRGSARSVPGFDLHRAVTACSEHLERFGGHAQAAGMEIRRDRIEAFREAFDRVAREGLSPELLRPVLEADLEVPLKAVSAELHRFLRYAGPFGVGNRRPVFLARDVGLAGAPRVVGEDHLKVGLEQGGARMSGIGFRLARRIRPDDLGSGPVDVAFHVHENEYRGRKEIQARLLDIRPAEGKR